MINQRFLSIESQSSENVHVAVTRLRRINPFTFLMLAALLGGICQAGCIGLTGASATDPTTTTTMTVGGGTGSFGSVANGSSVTQSFTITNTGSTTLTISQIATTGTGFSVYGFTLPITVSAGQTTAFLAEFTPSTATAVSGKISITANTNPTVSSIALTGTGT